VGRRALLILERSQKSTSKILYCALLAFEGSTVQPTSIVTDFQGLYSQKENEVKQQLYGRRVILVADAW